MSRYIDADALPRHGQRGGLVHWKDIENAPSIDIVRRKPVVGYEGYYEVDMYGNVYSVARTVQVNDNGRIYDKPVKEKIRQSNIGKHHKGEREGE